MMKVLMCYGLQRMAASLSLSSVTDLGSIPLDLS